jgi:hypothetical protein
MQDDRESGRRQESPIVVTQLNTPQQQSVVIAAAVDSKCMTNIVCNLGLLTNVLPQMIQENTD